MTKKYAWTHAMDDEFWRGGPCDSIKECVEEALAEGYDREDTIAIGYIERYEIDNDFAVNMVERLCEDAYDEVGEASDGWLDSISRENLDLLNDRLSSVINTWLKEIHEEPHFYKVAPFMACSLSAAIEVHNTYAAMVARGGNFEFTGGMLDV